MTTQQQKHIGTLASSMIRTSFLAHESQRKQMKYVRPTLLLARLTTPAYFVSMSTDICVKVDADVGQE
jgi:hypothetical protein